mmetsp:Transcript_36384/g.95329  ORF Transcript_36384/g.95329 Transcript_36384/m.95329 type:complete len:302 (+) Transcript_36384:576-1481(+)
MAVFTHRGGHCGVRSIRAVRGVIADCVYIADRCHVADKELPPARHYCRCKGEPSRCRERRVQEGKRSGRPLGSDPSGAQSTAEPPHRQPLVTERNANAALGQGEVFGRKNVLWLRHIDAHTKPGDFNLCEQRKSSKEDGKVDAYRCRRASRRRDAEVGNSVHIVGSMSNRDCSRVAGPDFNGKVGVAQPLAVVEQACGGMSDEKRCRLRRVTKAIGGRRKDDGGGIHPCTHHADHQFTPPDAREAGAIRRVIRVQLHRLCEHIPPWWNVNHGCLMRVPRQRRVHEVVRSPHCPEEGVRVIC